MDKEALIARRMQAEDQFNALQNQKDQKTEELNQIDLEMGRLQGEYRLLNEFIDSANLADNLVDPATTVVAEKPVKETKK